jgi:hypothetical protein
MPGALSSSGRMIALVAGSVNYTVRTSLLPFKNVTGNACEINDDDKASEKAVPFAGK